MAGEGAGADLISRPGHGNALACKQVDSTDIDPITVALAPTTDWPLLDWLQSSWSGAYSRRTGAIVYTSGNGEISYERHFRDALVVETTFPTLDVGDHTPGHLTMKLQPEETWTTSEGKGESIGSEDRENGVNEWRSSNFRLELFGCGRSLDCSGVRRIESFTIKQRVARLSTGAAALAELEHTGIEFPCVTLYIALSRADDFIHWHTESVLQDGHVFDDVRGHIELLDHSGRQALFYIDLRGIGILGYSFEHDASNGTPIRLCKVQLSVESMGLRAADD